MIRREDFINITDHLMKEPKLRTIKLKLTNNEIVLIYFAEADKYKAVAHTYFLEVITKYGNYTSDVFIPYDNILSITGDTDD